VDRLLASVDHSRSARVLCAQTRMLEMRSELFMPVPGGRSRLNPIRTQMKGYPRAGDPYSGLQADPGTRSDRWRYAE